MCPQYSQFFSDIQTSIAVYCALITLFSVSNQYMSPIVRRNRKLNLQLEYLLFMVINKEQGNAKNASGVE